MKVWKVDIIESEAGWGQRVDSTEEFDKLEDAVTFKDKFNAANDKDIVPAWYMYATVPY